MQQPQAARPASEQDLAATVAAQQRRLAQLEFTVADQSQQIAQQAQQIAQLERHLGLNGTLAQGRPTQQEELTMALTAGIGGTERLPGTLGPPIEVGTHNMTELTSVLEQKLRATETFATGPMMAPPPRGAMAYAPAPAPYAPPMSAAADDDARCVPTPPAAAAVGPSGRSGRGHVLAGDRQFGVPLDVSQSWSRPPSAANGPPTPQQARQGPRTPGPVGGSASGRSRASPVRRMGTPSRPSSGGGGPPSRPASGPASRPGSGPPSRPSSGASSRPSSATRGRPALRQIAALQGQAEMPVTAIAVTDCGSGLVSAGLDGQLQLWSRADEQQQAAQPGLGTTLRSAQLWQRTLTQPVGGGEINAMSLLSSTLACGCQDGSVRLFRLLKEGGAFVLYSLQRRQHPPAGKHAVAADEARPAGTPSEVMSVALSAHASRSSPLLASGAQDGGVCLWDSSNGRLLQRLDAHEPAGNGWVMAIVLARRDDGRSGMLLTASYDRTVKVWVRTTDDVAGGAMMACGQGVLSGGSNGGCRSCGSAGDTDGGGVRGGGGWLLEHTLEGHNDGVLAVELSRQRRHAFTGSNDHTVRIWELERGSCLHVLTDHESSVAALGWHLASGCLAAGAEDGTVHLWDVTTLERGGDSVAELPTRVQTLRLDGLEILCVTPSADGTALFCGMEDGSLILLATQPANHS